VGHTKYFDLQRFINLNKRKNSQENSEKIVTNLEYALIQSCDILAKIVTLAFYRFYFLFCPKTCFLPCFEGNVIHILK